MAFEKLNDVIEITLDIQTLSSLAIKAGDQPQSLSDAPVIKIGGEPVIPGSSLKGALRSSLEGLLAARRVNVCVPATTIPNQIKREQKESDYLKQIGRKAPCEPNDANICPVCLIFGTAGKNQGLSGSAVFLDARLAEKIAPDKLPERTHVAITRDTRSQAGGALVTNETVDAGVRFVGAIRLINPQSWQVGAILHALEWLRQLGIGSKKTAGYGQLAITVRAITHKKLEGGKWIETAKQPDEYLQAFVDKFEAKK